MSRKQHLIDTLNQYLEYDNHGALKSRQHRRDILNKIINDFYRAQIVPASWHTLSKGNIHTLVVFWQEKSLKNSTIMNYLVCLRYFLKNIDHEIQGIDNQSLNLCKPPNQPKPMIDTETVLHAMKEPIAWMLFSLQVKFGLTLHEAMHITPSIHIQNEALWITREISINHKDRFVPIVTPKQRDIVIKLSQLTEHKQSLAKRFGETHLRLAWRFALSGLNLPTHINYHYLYAQARFKQLRLHCSKRDSKKQVIAETSINKTNPLWKSMDE